MLALDIAGYSRLMELDSETTYRRVRQLMAEIVEPAVAEAGARIVKKTGDGAIAEFAAAADSVRCALHIQALSNDRERTRAPAERIRLRIGIHVGDIMPEADDLYGEGVNIAARLEALARPGDVVLSDAARQAANVPDIDFADLGVHRLRNIQRPVRMYRAMPAGDAAAAVRDVLAPLFGDRPAIAVLPFTAHADPGEAPHEPLADGIAEGIIAALSRWRFFPVISRSSSFSYRGRQIDARTVGQQLGARYVLEGSVRRSGQRLRTRVELVDVEPMQTLLSEHYDYAIEDLFAVQQEIVSVSMGAIEPELLRHERERAVRVPTQSMNAYEIFLSGLWHHYRYTEPDSARARELLRQALRIDPAYSHAAAGLAITLVNAANVGWAPDREAFYDEALVHARNAVHSDPRNPMAQFALGVTYQNAGFAPQEAAEHLLEAVRLDPSYAAAHANLGFVYNFLDRPDEALAEVDLALRLSPHDPRRFIWLPARAISHYLAGRWRPALAAAQEALVARPDFPVPLRYLAATLGQLGRVEEAKALLPRLRRLDGSLAGSAAYLRRMYVEGAVARIVDGLRRAGFD